MPYVYSKIAPTPTWVSISGSGLISIPDKSLVPTAGFSGTVRAQVSDGTSTATIDLPITVLAKPAPGSQIGYRVVESIVSTAIASTAMVDVIALEPVIILTTAIGNSAMIDTAQSSGGGGSGDFDNMALIFEATNAQFETKPTTNGAVVDEVRNIWRRQQFISSLGGGLINSSNGDVLDCTIERSQIWQWRDTGGGFGEWLRSTTNQIFVDITAVNSTPIEYINSYNPKDLGIRADFVGQLLTYRHASQTAYGEWGYASHRARMTTVNTGLPAGVSGLYWEWESQAMYASGT